MVRNIVFRGTLAGNACVSTAQWKRVATGCPHLPPSPPSSPRVEGGGWRERTLEPPHVIGARARDAPNETFLIRLLDPTRHHDG